MGTNQSRRTKVLDVSADYYEKNASEFVEATVNVDMTKLYEPFLSLIPPGGRILDAGCGSGRDAAAFLSAGLYVEAFDASPAMAAYASEKTGMKVRVCQFSDIKDIESFDGIWACASLLHVPRDNLTSVLRGLVRSLRTDGILYASFKAGSETRSVNGRTFTDCTLPTLKALIQSAGLSPIHLWRTGDLRKEHQENHWVNVIARK